MGKYLVSLKNPFITIKDWFKNSPYITKVDQKHYKLLKGGEYGDVLLIGKAKSRDTRVISAKGSSEYAISLPDELGEKIAVFNEKRKATIIEFLDDCDEDAFLICRLNGKIDNKTYRVEKK